MSNIAAEAAVATALVPSDSCDVFKNSRCFFSFEAPSYEGDATNQDALERKKIHQARLGTHALSSEQIRGMQWDRLRPFASTSLADLQNVEHGNTREFRGIIFKQGCPHGTSE